MSWLFAVTLFISATLLFLIQPIIGKIILPKFGGAPAVWTGSMLFFQLALFAGYAYAHFTPRWFGNRRHMLLHAALLVAPAALLPMGWFIWPFAAPPLHLAREWAPPGEAHPLPWLLLVLVAVIGLPFFVLSATAPLLQKWFSQTEAPSARDPYYLYAASNLGSLIALFGYPWAVEPQLGLALQGWLWLGGYLGCVALVLACLALARPSVTDAPAGPVNPLALETAPPAETGIQAGLAPELGSAITAEWPPGDVPVVLAEEEITWQRRLLWVARAFVPSSLMLGVTTYFTTDISPIPLLWVLPLAVYLLSFIVAFSRQPVVLHRCLVVLMPGPVLFLILMMHADSVRLAFSQWVLFGVHLGALFAVALAFHGEVAQDRPTTQHLTGYFLWLSLGGLLGGFFNAIVAPLLFPRVIEYPLTLALAGLLMPALSGGVVLRARIIADLLWLAAVALTGSLLFLQRVSLDGLDLLPVSNLPAEDHLAVGLMAALGIGGAVLAAVLSERDRIARALDFFMPLAVLGWCVVFLRSGEVELKNALLGPLPVTVAAGTFAFGLMVLYAVHRQLWGGLGLGWPLLIALLMIGFLAPVVLPALSPGRGALQPSSWAADGLQFGLPLLLAAVSVDRPVRFGLSLAAVFLAIALHDDASEGRLLHRQRSFFGVTKVEKWSEGRWMLHGTTLHGTQLDDPEGRLEPSSYYHRLGPLGELLTDWESRRHAPPMAVIGLGVGTMAGWAKPGQEVTFYEIDRTMVPIARGHFTYLSDAEARGAKVSIVLGDGRVQLAGAPERHYGLIVVDAFSSDAIPTHLMTREALQLYLQKLAPDGVIAFHISNRYLNLRPVVGNLALDAGVVAVLASDSGGTATGKQSSDWVMVVRRKEALGKILDRAGWPVIAADPDHQLWTDDYTNLLSVYRWRRD